MHSKVPFTSIENFLNCPWKASSGHRFCFQPSKMVATCPYMCITQVVGFITRSLKILFIDYVMFLRLSTTTYPLQCNPITVENPPTLNETTTSFLTVNPTCQGRTDPPIQSQTPQFMFQTLGNSNKCLNDVVFDASRCVSRSTTINSFILSQRNMMEQRDTSAALFSTT